MTQALRKAGSALVLALAIGCADGGELVRSATYPPNFNYIPADRLQSTMGQLAVSAAALEQLLKEPEPPAAQVAEILDAMEASASTLGPGGWPSNHPRISRNVESFRRQLGTAKREVDAVPPRYAAARSLTDACTRCHLGE